VRPKRNRLLPSSAGTLLHRSGVEEFEIL